VPRQATACTSSVGGVTCCLHVHCDTAWQLVWPKAVASECLQAITAVHIVHLNGDVKQNQLCPRCVCNVCRGAKAAKTDAGAAPHTEAAKAAAPGAAASRPSTRKGETTTGNGTPLSCTRLQSSSSWHCMQSLPKQRHCLMFSHPSDRWTPCSLWPPLRHVDMSTQPVISPMCKLHPLDLQLVARVVQTSYLQ